MSQVIEAIIELVITTIGVYLFGRIALNKKIEVSKSKFLVFFIITVMLHTLIYLNLTGTLKTVLIGIIDIYLYKSVFKISLSRATFLTIIYLVMLVAAELIQIFLVTNIFGMSLNTLYSDFRGSICSSLTTLLSLILLSLALKRPLKYILKTKVENNVKIIIYSVLTIVCSIAFFYKKIIICTEVLIDV